MHTLNRTADHSQISI